MICAANNGDMLSKGDAAGDTQTIVCRQRDNQIRGAGHTLAPDPLTWTGSYEKPLMRNTHEALVQFSLIVKDGFVDLIDRPHPLRIIRVLNESAREYLVTVARR